jgi:O-antigen/teichoic acid export membrane protein
VVSEGSQAIEGAPEPERTGWFHRHRFRIVIWFAVLEGIAIWVTHGLHITTIIVLGVIAFAFLMLYRFTTDRTRSSVLHETTWFLAASQLGATILVAAGYVLIGALIILLVIFALVALGLLLLDRR